jgi:hypothetical protein
MIDVNAVQEKIEKVRNAAVVINQTIGNITIATPNDIDQMAVRLSRGGPMVPPHCRGPDGVGVCHGLIVQALEWLMPIMAVINKSYVVNNRGVERIAYESQLIHAVIERNAPLKGRLRFSIVGDGDELRCKVWGTFKGEDEPHEYISETLGKLRDQRGRNDSGTLKGSPLWDHQPDVQLFYSASRQWARLFAPDVILGAYTPEDPVYEMRDVTPKTSAIVQRLRDRKASGTDRGFDVEYVANTARRVIDGEVNSDQADVEADNEPKRDNEGRPDSVADGSANADDKAGSAQADNRTAQGGAAVAGSGETEKGDSQGATASGKKGKRR